jgi:FAD/FMN-containing dehydrogenase
VHPSEIWQTSHVYHFQRAWIKERSRLSVTENDNMHEQSIANAAPDESAISAFRETLRGALMRPSDADYDAERGLWNGMIDRRPAFIVRCQGAADVIASVNFARAHGLLVAVRGGGHGVAGHAVCDGGMMIDLSGMRAVRVDPIARRAWVQGGATWGDVDHETTAFGLATPGGLISTTCVGGLTLSGGVGWLRGTAGLCVDNVMSADVVTADGRWLHASEVENADLYWAIRGGGGNFGIVVCFEFRLQPIEPTLMFCAPVYPESRAAELLPLWWDYMLNAPKQVSGLAEFSTIPDDPEYPEHVRGVRVLALAAVYDGPAEKGEAVVAPLRSYGTPLLDFRPCGRI